MHLSDRPEQTRAHGVIPWQIAMHLEYGARTRLAELDAYGIEASDRTKGKVPCRARTSRSSAEISSQPSRSARAT